MKWRKNRAQRDLLDEFGAFLLSLREIFIHHFLPKSPSGRNICIELLLPPQPDGLPVSNSACLTVFLYPLWHKVAGNRWKPHGSGVGSIGQQVEQLMPQRWAIRFISATSPTTAARAIITT